MKDIPRLLRGGERIWPRRLLCDLRLDRLVSETALAVLSRPCGREELAGRWELFTLLERASVRERVNAALSELVRLERALTLCREAGTALSRYHLCASALAHYLRVSASLASLGDLGTLLASVAARFSSEEELSLRRGMEEALDRARPLLARFGSGLLSFSDKQWLTPDREAVSEFERVASTARAMGFSPIGQKALSIRADATLSEALCRLHAAEAAELGRLAETYPPATLSAPLSYIAELRFFLELTELAERAGRSGVPHVIPTVADTPQYRARDAYDISLLAKNAVRIVPNDIELTPHEPFFFLTGANGGGKTTYLRAVGLNLILFLAGCPVFAREACVYPFACVAAHFPADERFDGEGRLDEERRRVGEMLADAEGTRALMLFNETYSGTDDRRGLAYLLETAERVRTAGHFGICVTHFHEVMAAEHPVLTAEIDPRDENRRTYRIARAKGSASSYAADILRKYRLDRASLRERREGREL